MKRALGVICAAVLLGGVPAQLEASPIYVGAVEYCEVGACLTVDDNDPSNVVFNTEGYIDLLNTSAFTVSGPIDDIFLTIEETSSTRTFVYGRLVPGSATCPADPSAWDFFLQGTECFQAGAIPVHGSTRFLFTTSGWTVTDFVSAILAFSFQGTPGEMIPMDAVTPGPITAEQYIADLQVTRQTPEPGTLLLLGVGAAAAARRARRNRRQRR